MQNFFNSISILFTFTVAATSSYATSIAAIGIGYVLANVLGSFVDSLARNPSLAKQLFSYAILGFALTEGLGLVALGMMPFFFFGGGEISPSLLLLQKVGVILGGQALSGGLLKVGCPWGLSIFIITLLKSWTWWPNLTCFIIEQDLNAPPGPEVVYLFSDEERREAIRQRFSFLTMSTREISPRSLEELLIMERAMEKRLLELGASPHRIVSKWGEIRGIAFPSINGNPLSDQTIHKTYKIFCEVGIEQSPPFLKIEKKWQASRLFLTDF